MVLRVRVTALELIIPDLQIEDTDHHTVIIVLQTGMLVTDLPGMKSATEIGHAAGKEITGVRKNTTTIGTVRGEVDVTVNANVPGRMIGRGRENVKERDRGEVVQLRNNQGLRTRENVDKQGMIIMPKYIWYNINILNI